MCVMCVLCVYMRALRARVGMAWLQPAHVLAAGSSRPHTRMYARLFFDNRSKICLIMGVENRFR